MRHKRWAISFTLQELMAMKIALGFFRRMSPRRGLLWQKITRLEPEIAIRVDRIRKLEKKLV